VWPVFWILSTSNRWAKVRKWGGCRPSIERKGEILWQGKFSPPDFVIFWI
jgi:hypothetical protein